MTDLIRLENHNVGITVEYFKQHEVGTYKIEGDGEVILYGTQELLALIKLLNDMYNIRTTE